MLFISDDQYVCPFPKAEHLRTVVCRPVVAASLQIVENVDSQAPQQSSWSQKVGDCGGGGRQIPVLTSPPTDFDEHSRLGTSTGSQSQFMFKKECVTGVIRRRKYK